MDGYTLLVDAASFATVAMLGVALWKARRRDNKEQQKEREDLIRWRTAVGIRLESLEKQ